MYYYIEVSCKYVEENDIRIFCAYTFFIDVRHLTIHTPFIISGSYSFFYSKAAFYIYIPKCIVGFLDYSERRIIGKIQKTFFKGRSFLEGKIQKTQKKISKNFIVPNRSLGHTDHLYTYKGHIEHVCFT